MCIVEQAICIVCREIKYNELVIVLPIANIVCKQLFNVD
jgi:hypothetical protein